MTTALLTADWQFYNPTEKEAHVDEEFCNELRLARLLFIL